MKHFNKTTKNMTLSQKFDYIKNHYTYFTMNSWNGLSSIANNVKLHNLPLTKEQDDKAWQIVCSETMSQQLWDCCFYGYIYEFTQHYNNYRVYSNGRSGGYLVLCNKDNNRNVVNEDIENSENYKELVKNFKEWYGWSHIDAQHEARQEIEDTFDLIVAFDDLCDNILAEFIGVLDNVKIKQKKYTQELEYSILAFE
nr:MAG TPA: hypothetical protein [Caudoviricetes sp.]